MPKKVFVVIYNDFEYGEVNLDVFASEKDAQAQLVKSCESCEMETIYDKYVEKRYDESGNLWYFAEKIQEDETFYECFIREETIQLCCAEDKPCVDVRSCDDL